MIAAVMSQWYYLKSGQQQGPVSLERLRELAQQGELKPEDLVWSASMTDWTPAEAVEGIFSRAIGEPPPPATAALADDTPACEEIQPGSDPFGIEACLSRGFELTKRHFGSLLLVGLVYFAVMFVVAAFMMGVDAALNLSHTSIEQNPFGGTTRVHHASLLYELVVNLSSTFLSLGLIRIGLNVVDGKPFTTGMLFGGGRHLIPAILAAILFLLMILGAMLPTIVLAVLAPFNPAIILFAILTGLAGIVACTYLSLRFGFYMVAIVDRRLGPVEALQYSSRITTSQRFKLFLLSIMMGLIILGGLICLLVGVIFAIPMAWMAWMVAYRWMQYGRRVVQDQAP